MQSANYTIEEIDTAPATPPASAPTSTEHNLSVAWPYITFSILLVLSLIGVALKLTRNQS